jgi:hypothetical protein
VAYSKFTLSKLKQDFGITLDESQSLFDQTPPRPASELLHLTLQYALPLATRVNTEKARSELLIAPVLLEIRRQCNNEISFFSGSEFNVDAETGLEGYCDYLLSRSTEQLEITSPVVILVEAKKENLVGRIPQCIAEMIAAQLFNARLNNAIATIYGAVTSGTNWQFLTLQGTQIKLDTTEYFINDIEKILGILYQSTQTEN